MNPSDAEVEQAIRTNQYRVCVFQGDNDVVDHQTVNMEFENGETAVFTIAAFNLGGRRIRIMGTKGELEGRMGEDSLSVFNFITRKTEHISIKDSVADESIAGGHGGGDLGIIRALCQIMTGKYNGKSYANISISVDNHLAAFAAEKSRLTDTVINMKDYKEEIHKAI